MNNEKWKDAGYDDVLYVFAEVEYKNFAIVLERYRSHLSEKILPIAFEKIDNKWKRTNKLSQDETFDIIFSSTEMRVVE